MTTINTNMNGFYIWFGDQPGREKITIGTGESGIHYTIIFKREKRVVDIHKTIELAEGKKEYEQILEMRWFTLIRFFITYNKVLISLFRKFLLSKRINLGKLGHHNLILLPSVLDQNKVEHFIDNKRKRKIRLKKEIPVKPIIEMLLYPDEIFKSNYKSFLIYSTKKGVLKHQGFIFQLEGDKRIRSYYFVSNTQFKKFIRTNIILIFNIINRLDFKNKETFMSHFHKLISNKK